MQQFIEQLTDKLAGMNPEMSEERARTWVELLWSDYEASSAKAGYKYKSAEHTAKLVDQLITSYGDKLHLFASKNPKFAALLEN